MELRKVILLAVFACAYGRPANDDAIRFPRRIEDDVHGGNVNVRTAANDVNPFSYLSQYGYLESAYVVQGKTNGSGYPLALLNHEAELKKAVRDFQAFAGLRRTGELDTETLRKMRQPRCGVADKKKSSGKTSNYSLHPSKWPKTSLTYYMGRYPTGTQMSRRDVDATMARAFKIWEEASNLKFSRTRSKRNADIRYVINGRLLYVVVEKVGDGAF